MIRRLAIAAAIVSATTATAFVGCGGSTSKGTPTDAGGDAIEGGAVEASAGDGGGKESGTKDGGGGGDAPNTGSLPDGSIPPNGTQLVQSETVIIDGVTSDGFAIYSDFSANTLNAVPVAGGASISIGGADGSTLYGGNGAFAVGKLALFEDAVDQSTGAGTISVWSSAGGVHSITTTAYASGEYGDGTLSISSDGAHALFFDNLTATSADISVVDTDGSNHKALVPGIDPTIANCPLSLGFVGAYAVVVYCTASDAGVADGGTANATIATFTGTGWTTAATFPVPATTAAVGDSAGAHVLFGSAAGLQIGTLATGTSATVDATGTTGLFTNDGAHVVYLTSGGGISSAVLTGASAPTSLVASGFAGLVAISPNDQSVLAYKTLTQSAAGDPVNDLYVLSTTTAGTPVTISSAATAFSGQPYGDAFTADSTHTLYDQNVSGGVGEFMTSAISGGTQADDGPSNYIWTSTTGSKVVFNLNDTSSGQGSAGTGDIMAIDTATTAKPTLLVTQADAIYFLTAAKDKIVYSWSYLPDSSSGIWVLPAP